jgi:hypothetical protein
VPLDVPLDLNSEVSKTSLATLKLIGTLEDDAVFLGERIVLMLDRSSVLGSNIGDTPPIAVAITLALLLESD